MKPSQYPNHQYFKKVLLQTFSQRTAIVVAFTGLLVILGWLLDIQALKGVLPELPTMKVNAAIAFILGGISLWLWHWQWRIQQSFLRKRVRFLFLSFSLIIVLIALLTLIQYGFHVNLGIDELFLQQPEPIRSNAPSGRMAPNTALALLLTGIALLFLQQGTRKLTNYVSQISAFGAWFIGFLGLTGYFYGSAYFYQPGFLTGVPIHTAFCLILLNTAILCAYPHQGAIALLIGRGTGSRMARRLLPLAFGIPFFIGSLCSLGYYWQLYSAEIESALSSLLDILGFSGLVIWNAHILNQVDDRRMKAESVVEQYAQEFEDLYNNAPCGYHSLDINGTFIRINDTELKWLGYSREEILHRKKFSDLVTPASLEHFYNCFSSFKARGWVQNSEFEMIRKDGSTLFTSLNATAIYNEDGQYLMSRTTLFDITERKQAEIALQSVLSLQQAILDSANYTIIATDVNGTICNFNTAAEQWLGYSAVEVVGKITPAIFHDQDEVVQRAAELSQELDRLIAPGFEVFVAKAKLGEIDEREWTYIAKNGDRFPVLLSITALRDATGNITGFLGIGSNITERKRTEQSLQNTLRELESHKAALDQAAIVAITDHRGIITHVNDKFCEISQYSKEELLGKTHQLIKSNYHPPAFFQHLWSTISQGQVWRGEIKNRAKDGSFYWVDTTIVPFWDAAGKPCKYLAVRFDITHRKLLEDDRQKLLKQETQQREELTLKNFALEQAKREAEAANRAKSEFLAMMSHEIRTPMNAVIGMTGLLLDTKLDSKQQDFVETIRHSGDALLNIINDILDFSKIESGKLELETHSFNLRHCIEEAIDLVAAKAEEKGIELGYLITPQTPNIILGDITRLRQILVNLLSNAIKFTKVGEVIVSATASRVSASKVAAVNTTLNTNFNLEEPIYEIQIAVQDTGIGIPANRLDRLFKSFSQVDASTTRHYGGTGLGLAISRRLSEMMGGTMWVESQGNIGGEPPSEWRKTMNHSPTMSGSTFFFTIVVQTEPNSESLELIDLLPELSGKKLLIVDDNLTNRQILTLQAEAWKMSIRAAESGFEALDLLEQGETFDVAILDMQMPGMDGLTLAEKIHQHPNGYWLPLVMLTSMGKPENHSKTSERVANHFIDCLSKPIKQSKLYEVLTHALLNKPIKLHQNSPQTVHPNIQLAQTFPLRILLAEDHLVNQKVALLMLERMGYRADIAANGLEVLQALRRQPYDVVLMDVQMAEMDGLEASRRICQEWQTDSRPCIIAMTANAMQGDREECLAAGMDDYISKPLHIKELEAALRKCKVKGNMQEEERFAIASELQSATFTPPVAPLKTLPALDLEIFKSLQNMVGGKQSALTSLINCYLTESPKLIQAIADAIQIKDPKMLRGAAHSLKSSSASLGATRLAQLCQKLEQWGQQGNLTGISEELKHLHTEYILVEASLQKMKEQKR